MKIELILIQNMVNEPVYHIWMQNWNSFFFLNHRLSSVLPCDFVLKYDDDQWPIDNTLQQRLINYSMGKNVIFGGRGYKVGNSFCRYRPKKFIRMEEDVVDHIATPFLARTGFFKVDARFNVYRLYGGEDIFLSLNSWKSCNATSKKMSMKLIEKHNDGNTQRLDRQIISAYNKEKEKYFNLFRKTYCYLIHSGYIPRRWADFKIPQKDYFNNTVKHNALN